MHYGICIKFITVFNFSIFNKGLKVVVTYQITDSFAIMASYSSDGNSHAAPVDSSASRVFRAS
ncbi:MAG: hypothetical protein EA363_06720 [Balneolaceae bacterium]|nr:MAG: hypothetical protein EA363_06720 [Balneolaceae bacterium]